MRTQRGKIATVCVLCVPLAAAYYAWQRSRRDTQASGRAAKAARDLQRADDDPNGEPEPVLAEEDELAPLPAAEMPTELTPEEEAAGEHLGSLVKLAAEKWPKIALDGKTTAPVAAEVSKKYLAWLRARYHQAFERNAKPDAPWREEAAQWIDDYLAEPLNNERRAALRDVAQRLVDQGCDDWLIRYGLFRSQDHLDRPEEAAKAIRILQPLSSLADSGYPPDITYRIYLAYADASHVIRPGGQPHGLKEAIEKLAAAISEPLTDDERRFYTCRLRDDMRGVLRYFLGELMAQLDAAPSVDRYLARLLRAIWHIELGWRLRGVGVASDVTSEGWKGFYAHLTKARILLLQCWDEHPEYPDAASELIKVTTGIRGIAGESPRFWFDEAVGAEFDFEPAYAHLLWSLRPRWGGSRREMLAFGRECLATQRFDTDVPWKFHVVLYDIGSETFTPDARRGIYQLDGVYDEYLGMLDGYRGDPKTNRNGLDSFQACVAWLAGRNEAAEEILARLGDDVVPASFTNLGVSLGEVRRGLQGTERPALANFSFPGGVRYVAFARNGRRLLVGSDFSGAIIADTDRGCQTVAFLEPEEEHAFRGFSLSPDGTMLATIPMRKADQGNTPTVLLWDIATQSKSRELTMPDDTGPAYIAAFSADGRYIAVTVGNGSFLLWETSGDAAAPVFRSDLLNTLIFAVRFSPDGKRLITAGADQRVIVWELSSGDGDLQVNRLTEIKPFWATVNPYDLIFGSLELSPDGGRLLVGGERVTVWDLETKEKLLTVAGRYGAFSPDGRRLATGGGELGTDGRVWDAETGQELAKLTDGHDMPIGVVAFSNDGRRIVTGSQGTMAFVRCWDAESGEEDFDFSGLLVPHERDNGN